MEANVIWSVTWTYATDPDNEYSDRLHDTFTDHVLAPPALASEHPGARVPTPLHQWAKWVGRANYGINLLTIEYCTVRPAEVDYRTRFDIYGTPTLPATGAVELVYTYEV